MRRIALLACQTIIWAGYPLSRLWFVLAPPTVASDIAIYFDYATRAWEGHVPYVDYAIEYPPAAFLFMLVPASTDWPTYFTRFRAMNAAVEAAAFVLMLAIARRHVPERFWFVSATYVVVTTLARVVVFDRLDAMLLFLCLAWVWLAWPAGESSASPARRAAAYAVLGLATAFKLLPGAMLLPMIALEYRRDPRSARAGLVAFVASAVVPFAAMWPWAGAAPLGFLRYHAVRGVEIESVWAVALWVQHWLGATVTTEMADHALEIFAPGADIIAKVADVASLSAIAFGTRMAWRAKTSAESGIVWGVLTLTGMVVLSKVLSPQFLIWLLPLLALTAAVVCDERQFVGASVVLTGVALITAAMFPGYFTEMFRLRADAWALVASRNALLVGVVVWLWRAARRRDQAGSSPA